VAAPFDTTASTEMIRNRFSELRMNMRIMRPAGKMPAAKMRGVGSVNFSWCGEGDQVIMPSLTRFV
jgi:hypothetical protein